MNASDGSSQTQKNTPKTFFPEIVRAKNRDVWPLTFQERQVVAESYLRPDSAAFNVGISWRLRGALDAPKLEKSISAFVGRHRVIRSRYTFEKEEIIRKLSDDVSVALTKKSTSPSLTASLKKNCRHTWRRPL